MQTGAILAKLDDLLLEECPDCVLVYGDTNSTLAGALAAAKLHIPVAHVEAGLRSFNRAMPEEINRVLTDHVSDWLFCPTETAVHNLAAEGITEGVHNVGDVMYDAMLHNVEIAARRSRILSDLCLEPKRYLLVMAHRPRNTDDLDNIGSVLDALSQLGEAIVFPAHPRTRAVNQRAGTELRSHIRLIEPVDYLDLLVLGRGARAILTDSSGARKEGYLLRVPSITLRDETDWTGTAQAGWNVLVGADTECIVALARDVRPRSESRPLFGDGETAGWILETVGECGEVICVGRCLTGRLPYKTPALLGEGVARRPKRVA